MRPKRNDRNGVDTGQMAVGWFPPRLLLDEVATQQPVIAGRTVLCNGDHMAASLPKSVRALLRRDKKR